MLFKSSWFKKIILALTLASIGGGVFYYFYSTKKQVEQGPIYDFDDGRDTQDILNLFKEYRYWLLASDDYSPEYALKHRSPKMNPLYAGKLIIKVLREQGKFVGFVAYWKESPLRGQLLFLSIRPELRGKRHSEKLMRYALDDMKNMGIKKVWLVTRTSNLAAQKVYNRMGYYETSRNNGYVYFEKVLE